MEKDPAIGIEAQPGWAPTADPSGDDPAELAELRAALERADEERADLAASLAEAQAALRTAIVAYREALLAANPDVPADLVIGASVDDLRAAVERGRALVTSVTERLAAAEEVPAGSAARSGAAADGLRGAAKIRHALASESSAR